jgi:heme/copper-type cytochrome/quinol oxidase subunit 4
VTGRRRPCRCRTCNEPPLHGIGRVLASVLTFIAFVMVPGGVLILLGVKP